jgi:hypothetical protein
MSATTEPERDMSDTKKAGLLPALRKRVGEMTHLTGPAGELLAQRVDRVFDRLESMTALVEQVAKTELRILERLEPIVEDLGALVKLQLEEARRRVRDAKVIDVDPDRR